MPLFQPGILTSDDEWAMNSSSGRRQFQDNDRLSKAAIA
jgi:hypothetical protein